MAITIRICINPPKAGKVSMPRSHKTTRTIAIIHNTFTFHHPSFINVARQALPVGRKGAGYNLQYFFVDIELSHKIRGVFQLSSYIFINFGTHILT
jgi:hypothetical protein